MDLSGLSLEGTLAPELGKLSHLKSLILYKNHFTGVIPNEFGDLVSLEILDLSSNNLSGNILAEIGQMLSLKRLILCNNKFHGSIPLEVGKLTMLSEIQFDRNLTFAADTGVNCLHRKFGHCIWQKGLKQLKEISFVTQIKRKFQRYVHALPWSFRKSSSNICGGQYCENLASSAETGPQLANIVRRQLLEDINNLPAIPTTGIYPVDLDAPFPSIRSSGSFPAKTNANAPRPDPPAIQTSSAEPPSKT